MVSREKSWHHLYLQYNLRATLQVSNLKLILDLRFSGTIFRKKKKKKKKNCA